MELDIDKIDEAVLALLALGQHDGFRAWKSFDWESMARLHEKGYITDPVGKAKSVAGSQASLVQNGHLHQILKVAGNSVEWRAIDLRVDAPVLERKSSGPDWQD